MAIAFPIAAIIIVVYMFILMFPIALLVALQVWLCKKGKWLGLILPGISLTLSLVLVFSMTAFSAFSFSSSGGSVRVTDEYGNIVQEEIISSTERGQEQKIPLPLNTLIAAGILFLVTNIPTIVFGGIWLHFKGRRDTYEDLKRMQIEDLE